jgi:hypothetical protein
VPISEPVRTLGDQHGTGIGETSAGAQPSSASRQ